MKLLLLSRYDKLGASSRLRFFQYLPYLRANGVVVTVSPLFSDSYLRRLYKGAGWGWGEIVSSYLRRLRVLFHVRSYDLILIEKELFPFLPAFAERLLKSLKVRYAVDFDDALFHRYDLHANGFVRRLLRKKIDVVMRNASIVIAGNQYLVDRAQQSGAHQVELIPTVVDLERYYPKQWSQSETTVIGWVGTPQTSIYLKSLLPIFDSLAAQMPLRVVAVGARSEDFSGTVVDAVPWSEDTEVQSIQQFDIGIMPLPDSPWERGKCGYKLIQYMACGVPVVASPVGVNVTIVKPSKNGLLAKDGEWERQLKVLLEDPELRQSYGKQGRVDVASYYSSQVLAPRLLSTLRKAIM